jgi:hypothetical protein
MFVSCKNSVGTVHPPIPEDLVSHESLTAPKHAPINDESIMTPV